MAQLVLPWVPFLLKKIKTSKACTWSGTQRRGYSIIVAKRIGDGSVNCARAEFRVASLVQVAFGLLGMGGYLRIG